MRLSHIALSLAAGAVFVLLLDRHTTMRELATERARAGHFANVVAECANGRDFEIDGQRVKCRPAK